MSYLTGTVRIILLMVCLLLISSGLLAGFELFNEPYGAGKRLTTLISKVIAVFLSLVFVATIGIGFLQAFRKSDKPPIHI